MIESFWEQVNTSELRQGDYLPQCLIPVSDFYSPDREGGLGEEKQRLRVDLGSSDLIVITHRDLPAFSCESVFLLPFQSLSS
jgi:hypothetical protein